MEEQTKEQNKIQEKENQEKSKFNFGKFHDRYNKFFLLLPILILIFSVVYMGIFYSQNKDFIYKDISLTGGTTVTLNGNIDSVKLKQDLSGQLEDIDTRDIYNLISREKTAVIIETKTDADITKQVLEKYLGYPLTENNSSFEFTGSTLSQSFFNQLIIAIIEAFILMGWVVFLLFGQNKKAKFYVSALAFLSVAIAYSSSSFIHWLAIFSIYLSIFFVLYFSKKNKELLLPFIILIIITIILFFPQVYFNNIILIIFLIGVIMMLLHLMYSVPSFAVVFSAFADIFMTLTFVNLFGIKLSSAGIVAFLMLIGYSVDTDILLTNRVLKREEGSLNERIFGAFKTGMTMTLTAIFAVTSALLVVGQFSVLLNQIFTIIIIGLFFDIINTWVTNVSLLKWYVERKK